MLLTKLTLCICVSIKIPSGRCNRLDHHFSLLLLTAECASEHATAFGISFHPFRSLGFVCKLSHNKFVQV